MSAKLEAKLFAVELSYPHHYTAKNQAGETVPLVQNRNDQRHIFCHTAERAIELARETHPDAVIHVVRCVGARQPVIIDPALLAAVGGETLGKEEP